MYYFDHCTRSKNPSIQPISKNKMLSYCFEYYNYSQVSIKRASLLNRDLRVRNNIRNYPSIQHQKVVGCWHSKIMLENIWYEIFCNLLKTVLIKSTKDKSGVIIVNFSCFLSLSSSLFGGSLTKNIIQRSAKNVHPTLRP